MDEYIPVPRSEVATWETYVPDADDPAGRLAVFWVRYPTAAQMHARRARYPALVDACELNFETEEYLARGHAPALGGHAHDVGGGVALTDARGGRARLEATVELWLFARGLRSGLVVLRDVAIF